MNSIESKMVKKYSFQNENISYNDLKAMSKIKVYCESSHFDRRLLQDKNGKLFLYEFNEFVTFDSRGDLIDEIFTVVTSEQDADLLNTERNIRRIPYIHVDNNWILNIYE